MSKHQPLLLHIPEPCTQQWAEMMDAAQGKFCAHCQKTVTDITGLSDAAIARLLAQQPDIHCIRARSTQLNRAIVPARSAPHGLYRTAVALGLTIVLAGVSPGTAHPKAPLTEQYGCTDDDTPEWNDSGNEPSVSGVVQDRQCKPLAYALLSCYYAGKLMSQTTTDEKGYFHIGHLHHLKKNESYNLMVVAEGYQAQHRLLYNKDVHSAGQLHITLEPEPQAEIMMGMRGPTFNRPFNDDTTDKDSLGHIPYTPR
jgi:hypothetical protein